MNHNLIDYESGIEVQLTGTPDVAGPSVGTGAVVMGTQSAQSAYGDMCIICRQAKGDHWVRPGGKLECPVHTYYSPCKHMNKTGMGAIGCDGSSWSRTTCVDCGKVFEIGTLPDTSAKGSEG